MLLLALLGLHILQKRRSLLERFERFPDWAFAASYGVLLALIAPFVSVEYAPFIYFQF